MCRKLRRKFTDKFYWTLKEIIIIMLVFGLTGGIASGKSTVSAVLSDLGCSIVDADIIAREGRVGWIVIYDLTVGRGLQRYMYA